MAVSKAEPAATVSSLTHPQPPNPIQDTNPQESASTQLEKGFVDMQIKQFILLLTCSLAAADKQLSDGTRKIRSLAEPYLQGNRKLEDLYDYYPDDSYSISCQYDESKGGFACTTCSANYCVTESCSFSDGFSTMQCDWCAADSDAGYNFCYTATCDLDSYNGGTAFEEACYCSDASLNGEACYTCEYCTTDDYEYDYEANGGSVSRGMNVECPYMDDYDLGFTTCDAEGEGDEDP